MAKKVFKIPAWDQGVMSNLSPRDIPDDALSFSENVDSRVRGTVKGRREDSFITDTFEPRVMGVMPQKGDIIIGQEVDGSFDTYDIGSGASQSISNIHNDFAHTSGSYGEAVIFGMSGEFRDKGSGAGIPLWMTKDDNYQFPEGEAGVGMSLTADIDEEQTIIGVGDVSNFSAGSYIVIGPNRGYEEVLFINSIDSVNNELDVTRAALSSVASSHTLPTQVYNIAIVGSGYRIEESALTPQRDYVSVGTITEMGVPTGSQTPLFTADNKYYYTHSVVYDGFQESPLLPYQQGNSIVPSQDLMSLNVTVNVDFGFGPTLSPRITAINLYRSVSLATSDIPFDDFRLVASLDLRDPDWEAPSEDATGLYSYQQTIYEDGSYGATYENNSGISETLDHIDVRYRIVEMYSGYLFAADCHVGGVNNAERYVYRSKPYSYSVIDWTNDYVILPEKPVALKGYNGRLYAFSESGIYRINTSSMAVEDDYRGAGALNENMAIATNYGMFHADDSNIYINDGRTSVPIGTPIQTVQFGDSNYGWRDMQKTDVATENYAIMTFDNKNKRLLVFGTVDGVENVCWAYDVEYREWHLYTGYSNVPSTFSYGVDGTLYGSFGNTTDGFELRSIATAGTRKNWKVVTKDFDLGSDSGDFWAYDLQGFGEGDFTIKYLTDGSGAVQDQGTTTVDGLRKTTVDPSNKKMKSISLQVESNQPTDELDNLTIQFRPQIIRE